MISRAARRGVAKNVRQKSISSDNSRLTARTFFERRLKLPSSKRRTYREESARPTLEIIVVITRSCGTWGSDRRYKGGEERKRTRGERKKKKMKRRRKRREEGRAGQRGKGEGRRRRRKVLSEDTISSRNVLGFYWEKRVAENAAQRGGAAPRRARDLPCYGPAGLNLVDYFVWGCRRQMVGSRERERINFRESAPRAAFCRSQKTKGARKYREMPRSNNPVRLYTGHLSSFRFPFPSLLARKLKT